MTVIAAIGFPDEVILISDSRASYPINTLPPVDKLKKIYQLASHVGFAYTTNDVNLLSEVIEIITRYSQSLSPTTPPDKLLKLITAKAKTAYQEICKKSNSYPESMIIYVAMIDKPYVIDKNKYILMNRNYGNRPYVSEKVKNISIKKNSRYVSVPPPSPLLIKQHFPEGKSISTIGWDITASRRELEADIVKYYNGIFCMGNAFNKSIMLSDLCGHYIKESKDTTVGGLIQSFIVDSNGFRPLSYEEKSDGKTIKKLYVDQFGNWIEEDGNSVIKNIAKQKL